MTAKDLVDETVTSFDGAADLSGLLGSGNSSSTVELLSFIKYTDVSTGSKYKHTIQAIASQFSNFHETTTTATDPATLAAALAGKDVFLVPAEDNLQGASLGSLGTSWTTVLNNFVATGGIVIVCSSFMGQEHLILNNSGLLTLAVRSSYGGVTLTKTTETVLNAGISVPFNVDGYWGVAYDTATNGLTSLQTVDGGYPAVLSHDVGVGHAVMIGGNYGTIGSQLDKVIANAVKWGQGPAVVGSTTPAVTGNFVDGVWTGNVTVNQAVVGMHLHVDDGTGHVGDSNTFDVAQGPAVVSATPNLPTIADASAGPSKFSLSVTYNSAMNIAVSPTISFPVENPGSTLVFSGGTSGWANSTTYVARYDVIDANTTLANVEVHISGAQSSAGLWQTQADLTNVFCVDTQNPTVNALTPADGARGVACNTDLVIIFGENVQRGAGNIVIRKSNDNSVAETIDAAGSQVTVAGTQVTIALSPVLATQTDYYVQVPAGAFKDLPGNDYAGFSDASAWNFTTVPPSMDHFEFSTLGKQYVGSPFSVTITATDAGGAPFADFNGSVNLSGMIGSGTSSSTVELLSFVKYTNVSAGSKYENTIQAIADHFSNFHETTTTATDPAALAAALAGKDVFLVPAEDNLQGASLDSLGTSWTTVLNNFVSAGGVVVVCSSFMGQEHLILNNSGLLSLAVHWSYGSASFTKTAETVLNAGVSVPFTDDGYWGVAYDTATNGLTSLQLVDDGYPVVLSRDVGLGHAVMIGGNYGTIGGQLDKVIANAVKWGQGPAIVESTIPTITGDFVNGAWTGNVTVSEPVRGMHLRADDAGGHVGVSGTFDVAIGPSVTAVTPSLATIADANAGATTFSLTVTFDETMNTGVAPLITFPVENPGSTLSLNTTASGWSDDTTYVACYDVIDANAALANVDVCVAGAQNAAGRAQVQGSFRDNFNIDTQNPTIESLWPADGTTWAAANPVLAITFAENVQIGTGDIVIRRASDDSVVETIPVAGSQVALSGNRLTITALAALVDHAAYYVQVSAGAVADLSGNVFAGISGATTWNLTAALTGSISGMKYGDLNANGVKDPGEPGLAGWTIFLDTDLDGQFDPGETSTLTQADGSYLFSDLAPGPYAVAEVPRSGWQQTFPPSTPPTIQRVSVASDGTQGNGDSDDENESYSTSVSADGRFVAFASLADNLVPGDTNGYRDIFVRDRTSGITTRVSTDSQGNQANGGSSRPSISADGRYVAFESWADNLVGGDTDGYTNVFIKDLASGVTTRIDTGGHGYGDSSCPSISANGKYVAFLTFLNGIYSVWVQDRASGIITPVSTDIAGDQANGTSDRPSISADGRYVAFDSWASNLVSGDTNGVSDVFVKDLVTGITIRNSTDSEGNQGNNSSSSPQINAAGRYVAFCSVASNLVGGDTFGRSDVFVKDLVSGITTRVSTSSAGNQALGDSNYLGMSTDGRYVVFDSDANNLVSGDTNARRDVFVKDVASGITMRLSTDVAGNQGNGDSYALGITADGRYVTFRGAAGNLVGGDTNGKRDIFLVANPLAWTPAGSQPVAVDAGHALSGINFGNHDVVPPDILLNFASPSSDPTPLVTVTVSDSGSGIANGAAVALDVDLNHDGDYLDDGELGYTTATLSGGAATFDLTPPLANGTYTLRARASDLSANEGTSPDRTLTVLSALIVTNTLDSGAGSLRAAIQYANATAGVQTISFNIPGAGVHTIQPLSPLPFVTGAVIIDGTTQPGYGGAPLVEINGASAGAAADGLHITAGGSTVSGLAVYLFAGDGIELVGGSGSTIVGCYLGTDAGGTLDRGNGLYGLRITASPNNTIGGTTADLRNVISGNDQGGIVVSAATATGNQVQGNYIGTTASGTAALKNGYYGIMLSNAPANTIGGAAAGAGNVISANGSSGIYVAGSAASGNQVQGNYIGTTASGAAALGNKSFGVYISNAAGNTVGGVAAGAGNVISAQGHSGIYVSGSGSSGTVVQGNYIGTDKTGTLDLGNVMHGVFFDGAGSGTIGGTTAGARNVISGNDSAGIVLSGATATGNQVQGNYIGTTASGAAALKNGYYGILLSSAPANTIGGAAAAAGNVISANGQSGVYITGSTASGNVVQGNLIGTDVSGTADLGNTSYGVYVDGAGRNTIGGTTAGARNVISGNDVAGLRLSGATATGNQVQGNYIGTAGDGVTALKNGSYGLLLSDAPANTIGGTAAGAGNVISANGSSGIYVAGSAARGNQVQGNYIGTTASGAAALGNKSFGVYISNAAGNTVGGVAAGAGNVISAQGHSGIYVSGSGSSGTVVQGNYIGTDKTGTLDLGNAMHGVFFDGAGSGTIGGTTAGARNVISGNDSAGIVLSGATATGNQVQGNYIGTTASGTAALKNGYYGIMLSSAPANTIGGAAAGASNVISANGSSGIYVAGSAASGNQVQGNYIGTTASGAAALGNKSFGVYISNAAGNTVGGVAAGAGNVISAQGHSGIYVSGSGSSGTVVQGNYIGTDKTGTLDLGNVMHGVFFDGAGSGTIGGTTAGARNVISGNDSAGIVLSGATATGNQVQGNYIGTTANGAAALKNGYYGILLSSAPANTIGGAAAAAGNVISANGQSGVYITGSTASGNVVQGNLIGTDVSGTADLGNTSYGVYVDGAGRNTIGGTTAGARNVISGNDVAGLRLSGATATGNQVQGNYIGTTASGTAALKNGSYGLLLSDAPANTIGGTAAGAGNVISANGSSGIYVAGSAARGNQVQGNYIGTTASGAAALGNKSFGVYISNAAGNTVGGVAAGAGNVISAQGHSGIYVSGSGSSGTVVQGNYIGTDKTGTLDLGNAMHGVFFDGAGSGTIGGTTAGARNVISGNDSAGIVLFGVTATGNQVQGNYIGTAGDGVTALKNGYYGIMLSNAPANTIGGTAAGSGNLISANGQSGVYVTGAEATGNAILGNSIYSNGGLGIDLAPSGVTANDPLDADTGPNNLQNYPAISSATIIAGQTTIAGTLNSEANKHYRIELFSNPAADSSGYGEGRTFLTSIDVTTDATGAASFQLTNPTSLATQYLTATATELAGTTLRSTSEFSQAYHVPAALAAAQFAPARAVASSKETISVLSTVAGGSSLAAASATAPKSSALSPAAVDGLMASAALLDADRLLSKNRRADPFAEDLDPLDAALGLADLLAGGLRR